MATPLSRFLSGVGVLLLVLGLTLAAAVPIASANQGNTCDQNGYTKLDSAAGDQTIAGIGRLWWGGHTLSYDLLPGVTLDLCLKTGDGNNPPRMDYRGKTGTGSISTGETGPDKEISHVGYIRVPTGVTPVAPTWTDRTCEEPGSITPPTSTAAVTYTLAPSSYTGPGTYVLTATPSPWYVLDLGGTGYQAGPNGSGTFTFEVDDLAFDCETTQRVVPALPEWSGPDCEDPDGGHITLPQGPDGVTYEMEPAAFDGPGTYVVTARASEGRELDLDGADERWVLDQAGAHLTIVIEAVEEPCSAQEVQPRSPEVTQPTCEDPGAIVLPVGGALLEPELLLAGVRAARSDAVSYILDRPFTGPGTYVITATAADGYVLAVGETGYVLRDDGTATLEVVIDEPEDCETPEPVTAAAPTVTPPACGADGTLVLAETEGVIYGVDPAYEGPGAYTVTAVAEEGYELEGRTVFEVDVLPALTGPDCTEVLPGIITRPPAPPQVTPPTPVAPQVTPPATPQVTPVTAARPGVLARTGGDSAITLTWSLLSLLVGTMLLTASRRLAART